MYIATLTDRVHGGLTLSERSSISMGWTVRVCENNGNIVLVGVLVSRPDVLFTDVISAGFTSNTLLSQRTPVTCVMGTPRAV